MNLTRADVFFTYWREGPRGLVLTPKTAKHAMSAQKVPSLMYRPQGGQIHLFTPDMEEAFWEKWFKNDEAGLLCYTYHRIFIHCWPHLTWNMFYPLFPRISGAEIESVTLCCARCHKTTTIESIWFDTLGKDVKSILCCGKTFRHVRLWRFFFWAIAFHNALLLNVPGLHSLVQLVPPPGVLWSTIHHSKDTVSRIFSLEGIRDVNNGEGHLRPGTKPSWTKQYAHAPADWPCSFR